MAKKLQRKVAARPRAVPAHAAPGESGGERTPLFGGRRVTRRALSEFTSQLSVLLDAGIPITKCLRILEGQMHPGLLRRSIRDALEDVESGTSFSEALAKHPKVFDQLYTSMVRAGEAGGVQEEILNRLAAFMEKAEEIRSRVKGALAYPIAVLTVATIVLALVFIFVIPQFQQIFMQQFGSLDRMHWSTQWVIGTGEHLQHYWWAWLCGIAAIYATHRLLLAKVAPYRRMRDVASLRMPVFGKLVSKSLVSRFSRTFGTLIQSGVPHLTALDIVGDSIDNVPMTEAIRSVHASIREGAGIAVPMGESGMFDDIVVNMVDVGEQTGELDRMLAKVADRYEIEVDRTIDTTFRVLETGLIVLLAVLVGFIVFALFSPLLKLMEALG
ncbi:MAG: type II secretion system F family protein [Planctomycetes bacterium]|nr:type II secretion system F family protein [Planctomycetota bacterium]